MNEKLKKLQYDQVALIAYAIPLVLNLLTMFVDIFRFFSVKGLFSGLGSFLLWAIPYAIIVVAVVMKKKDIILAAGFGVLGLKELIMFFVGFGNGSYASWDWDGVKFSFLRFVPSAIWSVAVIAAAVFAIVAITDYLPKYKDIVKKYWYAPAALMIVKLPIELVCYILALIIGDSWLGRSTFLGVIISILLAVGYAAVMVWVLGTEIIPEVKKPVKNTTAGTTAGGSTAGYTSAPANNSDGQIDLIVHILLLLCTCGIWQYIWIFKTTKYLNCDKGEAPRDATAQLLLCMFIPFYYIYWTYKSCQRIDRIAVTRGVASDITTICLILAIFVGIIPPILMQDKINNICKNPAVNAAPQAAAPAPVAQTPVAQTPVAEEPTQPQANIGVADEIKKYKDLLDSGAITEEEFDAKKKQLLGL